MMSREELQQQIERLAVPVDVPLVERALRELQRQGEDIGGGVNAFRLVRHLLHELLGRPSLTDIEVTWGYPFLKPLVMAALDELPGYEFADGG